LIKKQLILSKLCGLRGEAVSAGIVGGAVNGTTSIAESFSGQIARLPVEFFEPHWYAAYTCAKHEKRVAEQLTQRSLENFLPQYESVRRWKDRRVRLQLPLFPGYVFVRLALRDRLRVLETPSVVRLVGFNGQPAALPDKEIEALRVCAAAQLHTEPYSYLTVGRRVRIKSGPLTDLEGVLVRRKNTLRVVLSLDLIARSAAVEIDAVDVERIR
jgi:transcription antitermination factor NusG